MKIVYKNLLTGQFISAEQFAKLDEAKKVEYEQIKVIKNDTYVSK
mgnify:CR=1 FL=1|jgi:hypothetical protein